MAWKRGKSKNKYIIVDILHDWSDYVENSVLMYRTYDEKNASYPLKRSIGYQKNQDFFPWNFSVETTAIVSPIN